MSTRPSNSDNLLDALAEQWNDHHGNVNRDTVHLMTGRKLNGNVIGIANVGVICNGFNGYGLCVGRFPRAHSRRVGLVTHEIGHNWNLRHCDQQGGECRGTKDDCRIMCSNITECGQKYGSFAPKTAACLPSSCNWLADCNPPDAATLPPC